MAVTELGERLAAARMRRGWSQARLAALCGLTQARVSHAEHGMDVKVSTLVALCGVLGLEVVLVPREVVARVEGVVERSGKRRVVRRTVVGDEVAWRRLYPQREVRGRGVD